MARNWDDLQAWLRAATEDDIAARIQVEWENPQNTYFLPRMVVKLNERRRVREIAAAQARITEAFTLPTE